MKTSNGRSPQSNRILVVNNHEIMGAGLENMLLDEKAFEVSGFTTQDESALIDEIRRLKPDTIILLAEPRLTNPARLLMLLPDYGRLRIILVSIDSNVFEIYDRQQITASNQVSLVTKLKPQQ